MRRNAPRSFGPLYTTKPSGIGVGLAISRSIGSFLAEFDFEVKLYPPGDEFVADFRRRGVDA